MPRKARSVLEIDQVVRVCGLLNDIGIYPSPLIEVVTVSGKVFLGQLLRNVTGNAQTTRGWNCYGSITLATELGKVEIDYLDVVCLEKMTPAVADVALFGPLPGKARGPRQRGSANKAR